MTTWVWNATKKSARLLLGLLAPNPRSYRQLLDGMRVDLGWWAPDYEPMRVVDGELDNTFFPQNTPLSIAVLPPVYP